MGMRSSGLTGGFTVNTSIGLLRRWADALHVPQIFHMVVKGIQPVLFITHNRPRGGRLTYLRAYSSLTRRNEGL